MYSRYWHIDTERTLSKLTLYVRKLRAWKHTASSTRPLFSEWPFNRFIDNGEDWFTPITTHVAESMLKRVTRTLTRAGVYVCKGEIGVRSFNCVCLMPPDVYSAMLYSVCVFHNTLVVYLIRGISIIRHRAGTRLGNSDSSFHGRDALLCIQMKKCGYQQRSCTVRAIYISFFSLAS